MRSESIKPLARASGSPSPSPACGRGSSLPGRNLCESVLSFEAALIPSAPSPLLRGALAGAPQDEAKGSRGTRPPQDEEGFGRPHPEVRGRPSALPRPHPEVRGRPSAPPPRPHPEVRGRPSAPPRELILRCEGVLRLP